MSQATNPQAPLVIDVVVYDTGSRNHLVPPEIQAMMPTSFWEKYRDQFGGNPHNNFIHRLMDRYELMRKINNKEKKLRPSCIQRFIENRADKILTAQPGTTLDNSHGDQILKELFDFTDPLGPLPKGYYHARGKGKKVRVTTNPNFIKEIRKHNTKYDCRAEEGERYVHLETGCVFKIMRIEGQRICFKVTEGQLPGEEMTIEQFNSMNLRRYGDPIKSTIDPKTAKKLGLMTYERYHDEISTEW